MRRNNYIFLDEKGRGEDFLSKQSQFMLKCKRPRRFIYARRGVVFYGQIFDFEFSDVT